MTPAPGAPGLPELCQLPVHFFHRTRGNSRNYFVESLEQGRLLSFTKKSKPVVKISNRLSNHFAFRYRQSIGRILEPADSAYIQRKGNFKSRHTDTILPYGVHDRSVSNTIPS